MCVCVCVCVCVFVCVCVCVGLTRREDRSLDLSDSQSFRSILVSRHPILRLGRRSRRPRLKVVIGW